MKRFSRIIAMFAMVFASFSYSCYGQDIVNLSHIVQRGETLESLADRYRLTTEMLKTVNLDMDTFYTGLWQISALRGSLFWQSHVRLSS